MFVVVALCVCSASASFFNLGGSGSQSGNSLGNPFGNQLGNSLGNSFSNLQNQLGGLNGFNKGSSPRIVRIINVNGPGPYGGGPGSYGGASQQAPDQIIKIVHVQGQSAGPAPYSAPYPAPYAPKYAAPYSHAPAPASVKIIKVCTKFTIFSQNPFECFESFDVRKVD